MRILFVGATGMIGHQVVPMLAKNFDLKLVALHAASIEGLPVAACDITDFAQVMALMENVDAVVNCAIETWPHDDGPLKNLEYADRMLHYHEGGIEVNVRGAYHLYEAAARCGVKKFVFISSMTAVMGRPLYEHIERDAAPRPESFYACTKLFGEDLGSVYARDEKRPMHTRAASGAAVSIGNPFRHQLAKSRAQAELNGRSTGCGAGHRMRATLRREFRRLSDHFRTG